MREYNVGFAGLFNGAAYATSVLSAGSEDPAAPVSKLITEQITETYRMASLSTATSWIEVDHGAAQYDANGWPLWRQALGALINHNGTRTARWRFSMGSASLADKTLPLTGYDSGWLDTARPFVDMGEGRWIGQVPIPGDTSPQNAVHLLPPNPDDVLGNWDFRYSRFHWDDSANLLGYGDFGQIVTGQVYYPSVGIGPSYTFGREPASPAKKSGGGQTYKRAKPTNQVLKFKLGHIELQEAVSMIHHVMGKRVGTHRNFLVVLFPARDSAETAVWGFLRSPDPVENSSGLIHGRSFEMVEVL
jgi:hypothetical protein